MSDSDLTESQSDSSPNEIDDPESYVDHRRLKTIFDIRDSLHEQRSRIKMASYERGIDRSEALSAYRALISSYIVEVEPIFHRFEGGEERLYQTDFGKSVIEPAFVQSFDRGSQKYQKHLDVSDHPDFPQTNSVPVETLYMSPDYTEEDVKNTGTLEMHPAYREPDLKKVFEHEGLLSLVRNPDPLVAEWEIPVSKAHGSTKEITHRNMRQIDFRTLDNMMRVTNNFLAEIGFEVNPNEEQDNLHLSLE